jgi:hypothetical protein
MRRGFVIAAAALAMTAPAVASPQPTGTITGQVTDVRGRPLSGECVQAIEPVSGGADGQARTDTHGDYTLSVLPGRYWIDFSGCPPHRNYLEQWYPHLPADARHPKIFDVAAGETVANINARLRIGGQIRVRTIDADNHRPRRGIRVTLWRPTGLPVGPLIDSGLEVPILSDHGRHQRFIALATGTYYVTTDGTHDGVATWYPDAPDPAHATPIHVVAGSITTLRRPLEVLHGGEVSATMTGPGSQALGSTLTAWYVEPDGARRDETEAQLLGRHRYRLWLAPGTWTVIADTGDNIQPRRRITRRVTVTENGHTHVDFAFGPDQRFALRRRRR